MNIVRSGMTLPAEHGTSADPQEPASGAQAAVPEFVLPPARCAVLDPDMERAGHIVRMLAAAGYECVPFGTLRSLLQGLRSTAPDLVVSGDDGGGTLAMALARNLRASPGLTSLPLVAVGPDDEDGGARLLQAGIDLYLQWPLSERLFVARIAALLRPAWGPYRAAGGHGAGSWTFDCEHGCVHVGTETVALTSKEFGTAALLFRNVSRIVSFDDLVDRVWGGATRYGPKRRTLVVHVSRVRQKLHLAGQYGYRLMSVRARGYMLVPCDSTADAAPEAAVLALRAADGDRDGWHAGTTDDAAESVW